MTKQLYYFTASWCGPCQQFGPTVSKVLEEHPTIDFVKVDIDQNRERANEYSVMSIPTLLLKEHGAVVKSHSGMMGEGKLREWLN